MREGDHEGDLAERLAGLRGRLTYPPGVIAGVLQLPSLDPILDEVELRLDDGGDRLPPAILRELEALAALLLTGMLGTSPEALARRIRVVGFLRRAGDGLLPSLVADDEDDFGATLAAMLETDPDLRAALGRVHPLVIRAGSVSPTARWLRDARDLLGGAAEGGPLEAAIRRVLVALLRADVQSRPDILTGGLRLANQRLARGLLWLVATAEAPAVDLIEAVGIRMGTSGRSDAVVRDAALANTAAALLGESADPAAAAALASMRLEVTNRNVLKQVDRALASQAARAGLSVDELVDASLPSHGLDPTGSLEMAAGTTSARIEVQPDARVSVTWSRAGALAPSLPPDLALDEPGFVAEVTATVSRIEARLAEERTRLERLLGSERTWSAEAWRRRFRDHPIGRLHAASLLWTIIGADAGAAALPVDDGWISPDERPLALPEAARLRLWHPAEARPSDVTVWRATLAARAVRQSIRQVERKIFRPDPTSPAAAADLRFAGAIVDHPRMRTLLRARGWAAPALGAWDQGDEATAWRVFDDGLRAEARYQAPDRVPTGERIPQARIVAVRFLRTTVAPTAAAADGVGVPLAQVPPRVFSEALMDVALVVSRR